MTTLMKPEEEELTTSTEDLSLPLSLDKKVWLSFRSNCRARLLNAILEEFPGGLEKDQRGILEETRRCYQEIKSVISGAGVTVQTQQMCSPGFDCR